MVIHCLDDRQNVSFVIAACNSSDNDLPRDVYFLG